MKHSSVRTKSANCVNCPELSRWRLGVEIKANHAFRQASAYCGPPLDESKKTNKQREREREIYSIIVKTLISASLNRVNYYISMTNCCFELILMRAVCMVRGRMDAAERQSRTSQSTGGREARKSSWWRYKYMA